MKVVPPFTYREGIDMNQELSSLPARGVRCQSRRLARVKLKEPRRMELESHAMSIFYAQFEEDINVEGAKLWGEIWSGKTRL